MERKAAIVLIPGMMKAEKDRQRDRLVSGLVEVSERVRVSEQGAVAVEGAEGVRLRVTHPDGQKTTLDVYEAYWGDLINRLSQEELNVRIRRGTTLLFYWAFSRIWRGMRGRKYLTFSIVAAAFILLAWYYGTVALLLTALGEDPSVLAAARPEEAEAARTANGWLQKISVLAGRLGAAMGGWSVWLVVTVLMGFIPVNAVVDVADFARRYLKNEAVGGGPTGTQDHLRMRARILVARVCEAGSYERVTVVAHSFGCAIAVDVVADYAAPCALRLVTLGSPLDIFSRRAGWVGEEIERCASAEHLETWTEFYSDGDWFCAATPFRPAPPRLQRFEVHQQASPLDKLAGKTHERYFGRKEVVDALLGV